MTVNKLLISIVFFCCLLVSVYAPRTISQSDCANAEAAEDAIQKAWDQENKTVEVIELLTQAEASAQPPECDITKAINLAEEATQLARSTVPEVRVPIGTVTTPMPESLEIKARDFKLFGIFGVFWVLTISYAIYVVYRCVVSDRDRPRATKRFFWFIIALGMILPWGVGIGVKIYLQAEGKPTWPWSYFLSPSSILFEIPLTIWFASPFILLAFLSRYVLSTPSFPYVLYWERLLMLVCGVIWGSVGTVKTFILVFWEFHPVVFLVPLPMLYVDDILIGLVGGFVIAAISMLLRKGVIRK